ncbi:unnamed protein product [Ectocarpus sp. CCAP 1310/34]|nr:unnamed protein product [Ectocarpus sp. CCAP 1310/34]
MMDVQEIDDNSSQEANLPPATLALATKKRTKTKKDSPAVAPSSTLTRFLGPAGPPSRSAWDDVNRQCPVCQQTGFSSRSLALHVNDCLERRARADASDGESAAGGRKDAGGGVGNPDGRNTATATSVGKEASSAITDVTGSGSREGNTERMSREGTRKGKAVHRRGGEKRVRQDKDAKKTKTLQGGRAIDTERAASITSKARVPHTRNQAADKTKSNTRAALQHRLPDSTQSSSPGGSQQPTPLRRRALGLARPKGHQIVSDAMPTPAAASDASRARKDCDSRALDEIAQAQLLFLREASARGPAHGGGWLGTQLFPTPDEEEESADDGSIDCCCAGTGGGEGACRASCGVGECGTGRNKRMRKENRRVRGRPASWGARPNDEQGGWFGTWPAGGSVDDGGFDCWGDGDGYLTLKTFPPPETLVESDDEDGSDGGGAVMPADAAQSMRLGEEGSPAPSSRADCFLQVFSRLQPARRALKLHEPPTPPPTPTPTPQDSGGNRANAKVKNVGKRSPPTAVSPTNKNTIASSSGPQQAERPACSPTMRPSVELEPGGAGNNARTGTARSCEGERVRELTTPPPKRTALETISEVSAKNNRRPSATTASSPVQSTSAAIIASFKPVSGHKISRKQPPEERSRQQNQPAHQSGEEGSPRHEQEGHNRTSSEGASRKSSLPTPTVRRTSTFEGQACSGGVGNSVSARRGTSPRVVKTPAKRNRPANESAADVVSAHSVNSPRVVKTPAKRYGPANESAADAASEQSGNSLRVVKTPAKRYGPANDSAASATAPSSVGSERATSAPQARRPVAVANENQTIGEHRKRTAHVDRAPVDATTHGVPQPPPRHGSSTSSDGVKRSMPGATVAKKRASSPHERNVRVSSLDAGCHRRSQRDPPPGLQRAIHTSSQWNGSRSRGALASRASSGLLRSADLAARSENQHKENENAKVAPAANDSFVDLAGSNSSQLEECEGRKADVPQKGSLTVVWEHGATLRDGWSIDSSHELGRLAFGASLDYDAVWHLSPADADCVGVLRYRVVPHPRLAPTGGWISGSGRLRDDPYIIVKAEASPCIRPSKAASRDRGDGQGGSGQRQPDLDPHHHQGRVGVESPKKSTHGAADGGYTAAAPSRGHAGRSRGTNGTHGRHAERYEPAEQSHSDRVSAGPTPEGGRRTQPPFPSRVLPKAVSAGGSFGLATSPSAKALEANDSGDKVTCPVCNRGMDHWKSGQRQQHVHACLMKQPSSAKQTRLAGDATPSASRPSGIAHRSSLQFDGSSDPGESTTPLPERGPGVRRTDGTGSSANRQELPPGPSEGPRSTRVSLQEVFSPKPARDPDGTNTVSASRGTAPARGPATTGRVSSSKGLTECPVCGVSFGGRQGQWERQAHVQQCLDSAWEP